MVPVNALESSSTDTLFVVKVMLGGSFTGRKVTKKVFVTPSTPPLAVPPLSRSVAVTKPEPLALATLPSVRESVPAGKFVFARLATGAGRRAGLPELAEAVSTWADSSGEPAWVPGNAST